MVPIRQAIWRHGWDIDLAAHVRRGGHVLGICGGYQMLGRSIADPQGIEGPPSAVEGLGLLPVDTVLEGDKVLVEVAGTADGVPFKGYEMHIGRTTGSTINSTGNAISHDSPQADNQAWSRPGTKPSKRAVLMKDTMHVIIRDNNSGITIAA